MGTAHRGLQKPEGALDSLEFEFQMVVSLHVAARNTGPFPEQPVLQPLSPLAISNPGVCFLKCNLIEKSC